MIDKKGSAVTRVLLEALPPFSIYTLPAYFEILKWMMTKGESRHTLSSLSDKKKQFQTIKHNEAVFLFGVQPLEKRHCFWSNIVSFPFKEEM